MTQAQLTYLLLFPARNISLAGVPTVAAKPKDAPYFYNLDIEVKKVLQWEMLIHQIPIQCTLMMLDDQVIVAECTYELPGGFQRQSVTTKEKINQELRSKLLQKFAVTSNLVEEYTLLLLPNLQSHPSSFIKKHRQLLARFMRTSHKELDEIEIKSTLLSQIHYSASDFTIIDWEGAVVGSSGQDFAEDLDLFLIGNYQLLRYRMLDDSIERALEKIRSALSQRRRFQLGHDNVLEKIVRSQLSLLLDFEKTNQSLLLIGDWYSAKMYRTIVEEFYIDDWKEVVSNKLQSLTSIDETVRQNLTLSWSRLLDFIQIGGWLVILTGYFILFIRDMVMAR